jgi:hypothetical protein
MVPRTELRGKPDEAVDLYRSTVPFASQRPEPVRIRNATSGSLAHTAGQADAAVELRVSLVIEIDQRRVDDHRIFWPDALPSVSQTRVPP